jgi:hypothetical protein
MAQHVFPGFAPAAHLITVLWLESRRCTSMSGIGATGCEADRKLLCDRVANLQSFAKTVGCCQWYLGCSSS